MSTSRVGPLAIVSDERAFVGLQRKPSALRMTAWAALPLTTLMIALGLLLPNLMVAAALIFFLLYCMVVGAAVGDRVTSWGIIDDLRELFVVRWSDPESYRSGIATSLELDGAPVPLSRVRAVALRDLDHGYGDLHLVLDDRAILLVRTQERSRLGELHHELAERLGVPATVAKRRTPKGIHMMLGAAGALQAVAMISGFGPSLFNPHAMTFADAVRGPLTMLLVPVVFAIFWTPLLRRQARRELRELGSAIAE